MSLEQFLADPRVRPLPPAGTCLVAACTRTADGARGYCNTHYQRWRAAQQSDPGLDRRWWQARESGVAEPGQVNLRALPPLVVVEVLFGMQQRVRGGAKITDVDLRVLCDALRRQQVGSIARLRRPAVSRSRRQVGPCGPRWPVTSAGRWPTPAASRARTPGIWRCSAIAATCRSPGSPSPGWPRPPSGGRPNNCPRHRGGGAATSPRQDQRAGAAVGVPALQPTTAGLIPAALGRRDIEGFLNRLAYLESTGQISRYRRNGICRDVREVLAGIRALGLTRPGGARGRVGRRLRHRARRHPRRSRTRRTRPRPATGDHGQCCAPTSTPCNRPRSGSPPRSASTPVADPKTSSRLPLDCLDRDKDGARRAGLRQHQGRPARPAAADQRDHRRSDHRPAAAGPGTFPDTPVAELKLLPTPRRNPHGRHADQHRHARRPAPRVGPTLPALRTRDGAEFDKTRIVPYAYRHSYAQRHADAGVPIDVLAELLDHRKLNGHPPLLPRRRRPPPRRRRHGDRAAASTGTATGSGATPTPCWNPSTPATPSARSPSPTAPAPNRPTCKPAAAPARSGSAASGCDHFRTNVAYLPDLQAYLDDLLRTRERLAATIDGVDDWARADATPTEEEITRIRRLINRIKGDVAELDETERAADRRGRRHRAPSPRRPRRPARHAHRPRRRPTAPDHHRLGGHRMTAPHQHPPRPRRDHGARAMRDGRRADSIRRRQRVIAALDQAAAARRPRSARPRSPAPPGSTAASSTATATCSRRSMRCEADHPPTSDTGPAVTRASLQADLLAAHERAARLEQPASSNSRSASPKHSANKPGASPGSAPPPTSTPSTNGSPISNSRPSTCACNSTNATKTSPPPAPPTANSWPASTPPTTPGEPPRVRLHHTCCAR